MRHPRRGIGALAALALAAFATLAQAEPYLAVREGFACSLCHVNPSGGGMRTPFGDLYAQNQFTQWPLDLGSRGPWTGGVNDFLRAGGDLRYDGRDTRVPSRKTTDEFAVDDLRVYGSADLIQNRLSLYLDERLAPGQAQTREVYGLLWSPEHHYYLKAGRMYLPFGLRLQDDESFVREASGVSYITPDDGVEVGVDRAPWVAQFAVSNGAGGGAENDRGKQATASVVFVRQRWRAGTSLAFNNAAIGNRRMAAVFGGVSLGPVAVLLEADGIDDSSFADGRRKLWAGLAEADWNFLRGHNFKLTGEYFDPDTGVAEDQQDRWSAVWEWAPIQFLQTRVGFRRYGGIPQSDLQNRREGFIELHVFF